MNSKTKKILIITAIVLAIGGGAYYFYKKKKEEKGEDVSDPFSALLNPASTQEAEQSNVTVIEKTEADLIEEVNNDSSFPLKMGKQGKRVEQAQSYVVTKKGGKLPTHGIDGLWGTETESAMVNNLNRDNISKAYFITTKMYLEPTKVYV